jgi:hypothetical protein
MTQKTIIWIFIVATASVSCDVSFFSVEVKVGKHSFKMLNANWVVWEQSAVEDKWPYVGWSKEEGVTLRNEFSNMFIKQAIVWFVLEKGVLQEDN